MNYFKIALLLAFAGLASCRKKNDFLGSDNYITSFSLTKGGMTYIAAITDTSIIITAPDGVSLDSAQAAVTLSENASIYPKPSSIVEWDDESLFVVDAYNGQKKSYVYTVQRSGVSISGSVLLSTQAEVDAFGKSDVTEITGNLMIGKTTGPDSITNLTGLYKLRKVGLSLIIYPTFSGAQIIGLDNLQSVGGELHIEGLNDLTTLSLPSLQTAGSIFVSSVAPAVVDAVAFPKLTSVDKDLMVSGPLNALSVPNLSRVGGLLTLSTNPYNTDASALIQVIAFPALTTAGGISITNFRQTTKLDFPALTTTGDLNLHGDVPMEALYNLSCPALQTATGTITIADGTRLTQVSFPVLTQANGLSIAGHAIKLVQLPALKTVTGALSLQYTLLADLDAFAMLTNVQSVWIMDQSALVSYKGLQKALPSFDAGNWLVWGNAYNPSYDDLAAGNWTKP